MTGISAVIISRNEESIIGQCIQSVKGICDDIVLVDTGSTDSTVEIAKSLGARVFSKQWKGYGDAKNFGNSQALFDWILSVDADEIVSNPLKKSIVELQPMHGCVYLITPLINYAGHWVRYSGWYPKYKVRLFNRNECKWNDSLVHEDVVVPPSSKRIKLQGDLLHFSIKSHFHYIRKINRYSLLKSADYRKNNLNPLWIKRYAGIPFAWFRFYILHFGFLDGKTGYTIAYLSMYKVKKELQYFDKLKSE